MFTAIASFLGSGGFAKTANDVLRKVTNVDELTPVQRIEAFERILAKTQEQSPARRAIAFIVCLVWCVLVLAWLITAILGETSTAESIKEFMKEEVTEPFNYIIAFYFLTNIFKGVKK